MAKQKKEQKAASRPNAVSNNWLSGKRLYAIIIFAFSFGLYFNTVFNDYNLDDELVTQNHQITSKGWNVLKLNFDAFNSLELKDSSFRQKVKYFLPVVFRVPYYQDKAGFKYEYRPMVFASFALEHALFAKKEFVNGQEIETDSAAISHFINVVLYALLCLLLFLTLCALFKNYTVLFPFIITLLFAAYPMHTEVVASIKNRDEILALIFGLLSLRVSLIFIERSKPATLVLILLFFVLGILSKPTTIVFALLIPLCVVFFTNSSYSKLLLLVTFLAVPAVFYARLYSAVQQISLSIVFFCAVTCLYILKNRATFWGDFKKTFSNSYQYFKSPALIQPDSNQGLDFQFLKNPINSIGIAAVATMALALSVFGVHIYNVWLACLPLLVLSILYVLASNELKVLFTTPLALAALYAVVRFHPSAGLIETALLVFLSVQLFSGQRAFIIVGVFNYVLYATASIIWLHSFHFLYALIFVGFINRKFFVATLVLIGLSAILFFKKLVGIMHGQPFMMNGFMLFPIIYIFVGLLWKQGWKQALNIAALTLPVFLIAYFAFIQPAVNTSAYYGVQRVYYKVNSVKAADPIPVQSLRPLKFLEYPLNNTDHFSIKFGTAMEVLGKYLRMVIVPYPMSYYYGYPILIPETIFEPLPIISLLVHLFLFGIAIYFFNKRPVLSFSILFYLISIAVFSNMVAPIPGMVGDRFLLIPSIGFCALVLYILSIVFKQSFENEKAELRSLSNPLKISLAILLVAYSGLTFSRNTQWKDRLTLFRHDINVVENSAQAQNLLGVHLFLISNQEKDATVQKQLREEAIPHLKKALEIYPDFLNASYDLGRVYEALEQKDEALAQFQNTIKLDTTFVAPYFNMGAIMHNKGQYAAAIAMYEKFLTQYPKQLEAYTNLSFAYFQLNDFENSIATNRRAIKMTGEAFFPTVNIAKTYMAINQPDSAMIYLQQAIAIQPNNPGVKSLIEQLKAKGESK